MAAARYEISHEISFKSMTDSLLYDGMARDGCTRAEGWRPAGLAGLAAWAGLHDLDMIYSWDEEVFTLFIFIFISPYLYLAHSFRRAGIVISKSL